MFSSSKRHLYTPVSDVEDTEDRGGLEKTLGCGNEEVFGDRHYSRKEVATAGLLAFLVGTAFAFGIVGSQKWERASVASSGSTSIEGVNRDERGASTSHLVVSRSSKLLLPQKEQRTHVLSAAKVHTPVDSSPQPSQHPAVAVVAGKEHVTQQWHNRYNVTDSAGGGKEGNKSSPYWCLPSEISVDLLGTATGSFVSWGVNVSLPAEQITGTLTRRFNATEWGGVNVGYFGYPGRLNLWVLQDVVTYALTYYVGSYDHSSGEEVCHTATVSHDSLWDFWCMGTDGDRLWTYNETHYQGQADVSLFTRASLWSEVAPQEGQIWEGSTYVQVCEEGDDSGTCGMATTTGYTVGIPMFDTWTATEPYAYQTYFYTNAVTTPNDSKLEVNAVCLSDDAVELSSEEMTSLLTGKGLMTGAPTPSPLPARPP